MNKVIYLIKYTLLMFIPFSALASELLNTPHIEIIGQSRIEAKPDMAIINIRVNELSENVTEAKNKIDERVGNYLAFLMKEGLEKNDFDAANIKAQPEYEYSKGRKSVFKGYRVSRNLTVTLRNIDKLNAILNGAINAELNQIQSVKLDVENPQLYRSMAREGAIKDAKNKAKVLSEGFNSKLESVLLIRYNENSRYGPSSIEMLSAPISASSPIINETYERSKVYFEDRVEVAIKINSKVDWSVR